MQKEMTKLFEQSTETVMESARKVGDLNLRTYDKWLQQQADLAAFYMDVGVRSLELMTKTKGSQDLLSGQVGLLRECGERCMDAVRKAATLANESVAEYGALAQEGYKIAQDQATRAANLSAKAAA